MQMEGQVSDSSPLEAGELVISTPEVLIAIWRRRRFVLLASAIGFLLGSGIALLIPNE